MCKPHYGNLDLQIPIGQWGYFTVIPLQNGNSPITDPITKMGVEHAFEPYHPKNCNSFIFTLPFLALSSYKVYQRLITHASVVNWSMRAATTTAPEGNKMLFASLT